MVVVVIIGIVTASVVSVAFGDRRSEQLEEESNRLTALIRLAQEEAVLESRIYALGIWKTGYGFYVPAENGWAPLSIKQDKRLGARLLPEGMDMDLILDGIGVVLGIEPPEDPQVFILSSGEMTAISVDFRIMDSDREPVNIAFDSLGRLLLENDG